MLSDTLEVSAGSAEPDGRIDVHSPAEVPPGRRDLLAEPESARDADSPVEVPPGRRDLPKTRQRKAWAPSGDDQSIYEWVALKGETQDFVAQLFGIN